MKCLTPLLVALLLLFPYITWSQITSFDFVVAPDGAWTWFNDERAVIRDGRLYTSYVKSTGHTALSTYDIANNRPLGVEVHLSTWTEFDDHNNASLLFNSEDKLMAFYTKHHTDSMTYHRTALVDHPAGLADWGNEILVRSGANHTYNNAFQLSELNNTIYNFSRTNGYNPNWKKFNADGSEQTPDQEFIRSGDDRTRPYVKYASNNSNRIEFFFTNGHPRKSDNNLYHMYFEDGNLYQTDGTFLANEKDLPIYVDQVDKIYTFGDFSPTARPWTCSFNYSESGTPVVTYSLQEDMHNIQYYYAIWDAEKKAWTHHYLADAGDALYDRERDYTGLAVINPYDVNEVYMSTNVHPISGGETKHYEIYKGITSDAGKSFEWTALTENSNSDNLRPFVPKGASDDNHVLLWFQGTYRTYQDFTTKVVGKYIKKSGALRFAESKSYSSNSLDWNFESSELWEVKDNTLILNKAGDQQWDVRRPGAVATLNTDQPITSFELRADIKCTEAITNKGRDVIIVFGYQSPTKFYYVHLSNDNTILPHNGIFIVDGADRRRIDAQGLDNPPLALLTDQEWHNVRIKRNVASGDIKVFWADHEDALMTATDKTITSGYIGFGSFDNTGAIKNVVINEGAQAFVPIDDFNNYKNGNINGQGSWKAGPPGARDGGRVSAILPEGMMGGGFENNADGIQYRGNAYRDISDYHIDASSDFTLYFEVGFTEFKGTDFQIALVTKETVALNVDKQDLGYHAGVHFNNGVIHPLINGFLFRNKDEHTVDKGVYQFWLFHDSNAVQSSLRYRLKNSDAAPKTITLSGAMALKNKGQFNNLIIYNNPETIPTKDSYIDNIYISKGTNTSVPIFDKIKSSNHIKEVNPITNPFKDTILYGDLKLKMVEVATIPRSAEGHVAARINNLTHANDGSGRLFINDLRNNLYLLKDEKVSVYLAFKDSFPDFVDAPRQNSGLGYVAFHPEFKSNGLFYTTHTEAGDALQSNIPDYKTGLRAKAHHVVIEWKAKDPNSDEFEGSRREILRIGMSTFLHGIQALNFNPTVSKGDADYALLYISMGDGEENPNQTTRPQSTSTHEAKIFRIDPSGNNSVNGQYGIPSDNPFVHTPEALPEIWVMGIRNPHRMTWDMETGKMFFCMIGENQIDAIFEGIPGANYGWNEREGGFVFDRNNPSYVEALPPNDSIYGFTYPIIQMDHDDSKALIASGVYRGKEIPELYGKFVCGDLVFGQIWYCDASEMITGGTPPKVLEARIFNESNKETRFVKEVSHYYRADLKFGKDEVGEIYVMSKTNGKVYKLVGMK